MKKIFTILCVAIILLVTVIIFFFVGKKERPEDSMNFNEPQIYSGSSIPAERKDNLVQCKSDPSPRFTAPFTDLSRIDALGILGGAVGGSPGRSYVTVKKGEKVPVYNPMEAVLETIVWADRGGGQPEYGFYFSASCEVTYLLDHVEEIADGIKNLRPGEPATSTRTELGSHPGKIIKAGELLGYTDGTPQARTFDFLVINRSKPVFHVNPMRWKWEQAVCADCPYDYYEGGLKEQYYALLGTQVENSKLLKADSCGSPSQDVAGTVSGGWFQGDSTTEKGRWAIFGQQYDWMEMGIREGGADKIFTLKEFDPKVTPDKVVIGQTACFQGYENNWAFVKLQTDTRLLMVTGIGRCPRDFPDAQAEMWER